MRNPGLRFLPTTCLLLILTANLAQSQDPAPRLISHQGLLTDGTNPVADGPYNMLFSIYDVPSGANTALWTEGLSVNTTNGVFDVLLGNTSALSLPFNVPYYLGVKVGADPEIAPRTELTASPYAMGLSLPIQATFREAGDALVVDKTGGHTGVAIAGLTDGPAFAVYGYSGAGGTAVGGLNEGTGRAAWFEAQGAGNVSEALYAEHEGAGTAVAGKNIGSGQAGSFVIDNGSNPSTALHVETNGTGTGVHILANSATRPHLFLQENENGDFARLRMRNDSDTDSWDIAAGGANNDRLNFFKNGVGDIVSVRSSGRVAIGAVEPLTPLHVAGVATADKVVYNTPRDHVASVAGHVFVPRRSDNTVIVQRGLGRGGAYFDGGTQKHLLAAVQLPDGATITSFTCFYNDSSSIQDIGCTLFAYEPSGGVQLTVADVLSSGAPGETSTPDNSIANASVDNSTRSYFVQASSTGDWSVVGDDLRIMQASIRYTLVEAQ